MADSFSDSKKPFSTQRATPVQKDLKISCRATNPLSIDEDLGKVFLDETQAKATTATRLFRNEDLFETTKKLVKEFIAAGKSGKFCMWSTGCSSGEEVYSMAMIALNEFEKVRKAPQLEAFGTDINRNRIIEGRGGAYIRPGKDALNAEYWRLLNHYAEVDNSAVYMGEQLMKTCFFTLFDMRKKPKKHTFHFIVCNHVLQYYDTPGQRHIIGNLTAVLKPGGTLYLEGLTDHSLDGTNVKKVPGTSNLYRVIERKASGRTRIRVRPM
jgi:two-component system CheB/CheR fusion protein